MEDLAFFIRYHTLKNKVTYLHETLERIASTTSAGIGTMNYFEEEMCIRDSLLNIHTMQWDNDLLELFTIPKIMMPELLPCDAAVSYTHLDVYKRQNQPFSLAHAETSLSTACL